MHKFLIGTAAVAALGILSPSSEAAELEIQITGFDIFFGFDGKFNIQTGPSAGMADELEAATFFVDGESIGTLVGDMKANIGLPGFLIPAAGGVTSNDQELGYFNVDFDTPVAGEGFLNLNVGSATSVTAFYTGNEIGLSFIGEADFIAGQEPLSRLPAWPGFDAFDLVTFSFVSTDLDDVETDGSVLTKFRASGSGTINGEAIPEPGTAALLASAGLIALRRRRA